MNTTSKLLFFGSLCCSGYLGAIPDSPKAERQKMKPEHQEPMSCDKNNEYLGGPCGINKKHTELTLVLKNNTSSHEKLFYPYPGGNPENGW